MAEGHAIPCLFIRPPNSINSCCPPKRALERSTNGCQDGYHCYIALMTGILRARMQHNAMQKVQRCDKKQDLCRTIEVIGICFYLLCVNEEQADIRECGIAVYLGIGTLLILYWIMLSLSYQREVLTQMVLSKYYDRYDQDRDLRKGMDEKANFIESNFIIHEIMILICCRIYCLAVNMQYGLYLY